MSADSGGFADTWRRVNDTVLAPFVVLPNLGLAAVNAVVGATARLAERAVQATGGAFGTAGELAERVSERVAAGTLGAAREAADTALQAMRNAAGGMTGPGSNALLASTVLHEGPATAALPLAIGWDALAAAWDVPAIENGAYELWLQFCRVLDTRSSFGVLTGRQRLETDASMRLAFLRLAPEGPWQAVLRDFNGVVGGVLALGMGDFSWLARGANGFWGSMEYVYDKALAGETLPQVDFPIGQLLAKEAAEVIKRFPRQFVAALASGDPVQVVKALNEEAGEVFTMLALYPFCDFQVIYDTVVYILPAWLQVADAPNYVLCELAVVDSDLSDENKEYAMGHIRETAGKATIEFEYYVPLVVPLGGTAADQALRTSVTGKVINHHTIAPSVFEESAVQRAQSLTSELVQMRAFLWLYRDEAKAREKSYRETARKFGRAAADRIEQQRREGRALYPLTPKDVAELIQPDRWSSDVPRSQREVNEILYEVLHRRGLLYVANLLFPLVAERKQQLSAAYRPELAVAAS